MPRFAANLSMMFTEVPFLDRFAAARESGFEAVEFLFPYDHAAREIKSRLDGEGLTLALFNTPPGDWGAGERGLAALPGREAEFRRSVALALDYAVALGRPLVHCMAGVPPAGTPPGAAAGTFAANLDWAAGEAAGAGVRLTIEPINGRDVPGYFLDRLAQAAGFVAACGPHRVGLQFDLYHAQISEGDLTERLRRHMPATTHVQIADVPGRHEPGTGEIGWRHLFREIDALGYSGWIGCEYRPLASTTEGLIWREFLT